MSFVATIEADINKWTPNLDKAGKDINNFANNTKKDLDKVSRAQKGAGTVAMEFNRIIQDAPFGMMGISNNLTQLTDNYKTYAQSVKQAALEQGKSVSNFQIFKGAVAGILSPINLFSLGISAVTSGLILYQQWQQRAKKVTKETSDKFKELAENLNNISATMYKAAQSSGNEVAQLNALYKITTDVNQSTNARKKAAKDLIDQYPALFGKFSQEQVMLGKAKTAYDEVSKSIIATARAQAAYGRIGEKASQQLAIDETNRSLQKEIALLDVAIKRQEDLTTAGQSVGAAAEAVESGNVRRLNDLYEQRSKILNQVTGNLVDRAKIQEDINQLEGFAITNQAKTVEFTEKADKKTKDLTDSISKLMSELNGSTLSEYDRRIFEIGVKYEGIFKSIKNIGDTSKKENAFGLATQAKQFEVLNVQIDRYNDKVKSLVSETKKNTIANIGLNFNKESLQQAIKIPIELNPVLRSGVYEKGISKMTEKLLEDTKKAADKINEEFTNTISNGIIGGISDLMSTVGTTLSEGGNLFEGIGKGLLKALGGLAKSIGEQMIAFGVAGLALKKLMLNPFLSIAAGAALVALGSFASSSIGSQTSNFNGTNASSYGSSMNSSASFMPRGAYYNNDKQVVNLKIEGNNLVGAYAINKDRNSRSK